MRIDTPLKNALQFLLLNEEVNFELHEILRAGTIYITQILADNLIEKETSECGFHNDALFLALRIDTGSANLNHSMKSDNAVLICKDSFVDILEEFAFSLIPRLIHRQIVNTENHILGRNGYRAAVGRLQQVVRR